MEKTLYVSLINADDGVHVFNKEITDPAGEYEDFETFCDNKAAELAGELFGPFAVTDIVEQVVMHEGPCTPGESIPVEYTDEPYTPEEEADLDRIIHEARQSIGLE